MGYHAEKLEPMESPLKILTEEDVRRAIAQAMEEHEQSASRRGWIMLVGLMCFVVLVKIL